MVRKVYCTWDLGGRGDRENSARGDRENSAKSLDLLMQRGGGEVLGGVVVVVVVVAVPVVEVAVYSIMIHYNHRGNTKGAKRFHREPEVA